MRDNDIAGLGLNLEDGGGDTRHIKVGEDSNAIVEMLPEDGGVVKFV